MLYLNVKPKHFKEPTRFFCKHHKQVLVSGTWKNAADTWEVITKDFDGSVAFGVSNLLVSFLQGVSLQESTGFNVYFNFSLL